MIKDEASRPAPKPQTYHDVASGTKNEVLTPGDGALLMGYRLPPSWGIRRSRYWRPTRQIEG